jgi:hypothetical protein
MSTLTSIINKTEFIKTCCIGSFIFTGRDNVAARNTPIQLGYGRLKVGTNVINAVSFNFDSSYAHAINNTVKTEVGVGNYSSLI